MVNNTQQIGMIGVYLAAAELSHRGFIVSPTSRSARGADLLVTDQGCRKAWSVQVKTNANADRKPRTSWRLTENARAFNSESHAYVFVNLNGANRPEYMVVPSSIVAAKVKGKGTLCYFNKSDGNEGDGLSGEGWELFGDPKPRVRRKRA
jgi:hypothetical protein